MLSAEIRQSFLNFFAGRDHLVLPSASLVPHSDPSLLLTNAGMVQFKTYYAGSSKPPAPRVTTVQKCFRTVDLEEVGDTSHLSFFEMLGNFSFGDYFKDGAIELAWEFLTGEMAIAPGRLWASVYPGDDEAAAAWRRVSGREPYPLEENYWPPNLEGWLGPCGPDSEIYYDLGLDAGCGQQDCFPGHCGRYLELWNLVFPQFDRQADASMPLLQPPGIDTGMGLERLAAVLGGFKTIHETDLFAALGEHFRVRSGDVAGEPAEYARRLLADHSRATAFLVADGVRPGNEGRGYVLRKMVRRATLHGVRKLGLSDALSGAVETVAELMGDAYPEVLQRAPEIASVLASEEGAFRRTIEQGEAAFRDVVARSSGIIRGEDAFRLHDTFGFPIELTVELAAEEGLSVDRQGFEASLAEARQVSRRGSRKQAQPRTGLPPTEFAGYDSMVGGGVVVRLFREDKAVEEAGTGDEVEVYLDRSPMYAESGGQVGDAGIIEGPEGTVEIRDVQKQGEAHAHYGRVVEGRLRAGDQVRVEVDADARWSTMRHHSSTHLLHRALREVLGDGARQAGSYVGPEACTFDFTLDRTVSAEELDAVFSIVNRAIRDDLVRDTTVMALEDAKRSGAMHLFGEKYGDQVRVVRFGEFSSELCGGTHVERTGQIGIVAPLGAAKSVGAGVRRVEFLAGDLAERHLRTTEHAAVAAADRLNARIPELAARVDQLLEERRQLQRQVEDLKRKALGGSTQASGSEGAVAFQVLDSAEPGLLREAADRILDGSADAQAALVLGREADSGRIVIKVREGSAISAAEAMQVARSRAQVSGGGSQRMAQGGFSVAEFDAVFSALKEALSGSGATA